MKKQLRKDWMLGFLGFMGFMGIPYLLEQDWIGITWFLWFVWFIRFIPVKKRKE